MSIPCFIFHVVTQSVLEKFIKVTPEAQKSIQNAIVRARLQGTNSSMCKCTSMYFMINRYGVEHKSALIKQKDKIIKGEVSQKLIDPITCLLNLIL